MRVPQHAITSTTHSQVVDSRIQLLTSTTHSQVVDSRIQLLTPLYTVATH
jgi:hypothetical protein